MKEYTTISNQLKRGIINFSEKICERLSRTNFKFISCMLYGLLKSQSVMLSESESVKRKHNTKKSDREIIEKLNEIRQDCGNKGELYKGSKKDNGRRNDIQPGSWGHKQRVQPKAGKTL